VTEVQGGRKFTVYSDVCLRYRVGKWLLCIVKCVSLQGGRKVTVYSDVCLRYRVGEKLLCIVMCV